MEFEEIVKLQLEKHASSEPQDMVKLCYQAAYGAEHLLRDKEAAERYLREEFQQTEESGEDLYEPISETMCRVNIGAWKRRRLPVEWLFRLFTEAAKPKADDGEERFRSYLDAVGKMTCEGLMPFGSGEWEGYMEAYSLEAPRAVHHSERYRKREKPAYRLVNRKYVRIFPILEALAEAQGRIRTVAIDGRAAAGKSTLAELLRDVTGAGVIHMDDFFLPPALRTKERLSEPGGNVDYDRVISEVLPGLQREEAFSYRCFDCGTMEMGQRRYIEEGCLRIVEGAYSCHPRFGEYMTISVFCDVPEEEQRKRIGRRNGKEMLERFVREWIPMEEKYFAAFRIREKADVVL